MKNKKAIQRWIVILLIAAIGFFWRNHLFAHYNVFVGDIGRDMLAGHLILKERLLISEGHTNSGINSNYPSTYYYFISLLTAIGQDQYQIISILIILYQSIGIILLFILIKNSFSYLPAFVVSIFYAFSLATTNFSLFQISAHNSIPIALIAALLLQIGIKKNNLLHLALSGFFLVLATSFFYGAILFFPFYLILIIAITIKKDKYPKNLLPSLIFATSFFVFLILLFAKTLNYDRLQYKLIGSGTYKFQQGIENFQINQQLFSNILNKIYDQVWRVHPKLTFVICLIYLTFVLLALKNKEVRKKIILFLIIIFIHLLLDSVQKNTMQHYLIYVDLLLIYAWGFILQQVLNKQKFLFIIFSILFLYSGDLFHNYNYTNSVNYQHYQKVNQIIMQNYPGSSIISWDHCEKENYGKKTWTIGNEPWESRIFWYFQKDQPSLFKLDDKISNIGLLTDKLVFICFTYEWQLEEDLDLKERIEKESMFNFQINDRVYYVYNSKK